MKTLTIALCIATLTLPLSVTAAEKDASHYIDKNTNVDVATAERTFYNAYNKLNSEKRFHIICENESATGSRIATQVCRSKSVRKLISKANKSKMRTGLAFLHADAKNKLQKAQLDTMAHIEKIVEANPSLIKKLVDVSKAKELQIAGKR